MNITGEHPSSPNAPQIPVVIFVKRVGGVFVIGWSTGDWLVLPLRSNDFYPAQTAK